MGKSAYLWIQTHGVHQEVLEHASIVMYNSNHQIITMLYISPNTLFLDDNEQEISLRNMYQNIVKDEKKNVHDLVPQLYQVMLPYIEDELDVPFPSEFIHYNYPTQEDKPLFYTSWDYNFDPVFDFREEDASEVEKTSNTYQSVMATNNDVVMSKFFQFYFAYHLQKLKAPCHFFTYLMRCICMTDDFTNLGWINKAKILFLLKDVSIDNMDLIFFPTSFDIASMRKDSLCSFFTNIDNKMISKNKTVVVVLNACGIKDLARKTSEAIRNDDFDVIMWSNYPSRDNGFLINYSKNRHHARQLAKFIDLSPNRIISLVGADDDVEIKVILGKDMKDLHFSR